MADQNVKHPGLILKEEIEALGLSIPQAAKMTGVTSQHLKDLFSCFFRLGPLTAIRLQESSIGSRSAQEWLELQVRYDLAKAHAKLADSRAQRAVANETEAPTLEN